MAKFQKPVIQINNLTKKYTGKKVVNNINLNIPKSCFVLLGPNGAGKTTIILMLLGLIKPTSGTAELLGKDITSDLDKIKNMIGYLPENLGFFPNLTGWDHLAFFYRLRTNNSTNSQIIEASLKWCGLEEDSFYKKVKTYSKGMKQRLGLAQAFIGNPKIVFLDEPLSNIDPIGREDLINKIKQKQRKGITIIISSHIIQEMEQISDYIAIINKGKILAHGTYIELALKQGFNEFEITFQELNHNVRVQTIYNELHSNKELAIETLAKVQNKIIVKTHSIFDVISFLNDIPINAYLIKPIDGTLLQIYKNLIIEAKK